MTEQDRYVSVEECCHFIAKFPAEQNLIYS